MKAILKRVNKVFQIVFEREDLIVTEKTCSGDIPGWDSLQHINLLSMLEEEFGIEFDIDEIVSMENVGDMLKVIENAVNSKAK